MSECQIECDSLCFVRLDTILVHRWRLGKWSGFGCRRWVSRFEGWIRQNMLTVAVGRLWEGSGPMGGRCSSEPLWDSAGTVVPMSRACAEVLTSGLSFFLTAHLNPAVNRGARQKVRGVLRSDTERDSKFTQADVISRWLLTPFSP